MAGGSARWDRTMLRTPLFFAVAAIGAGVIAVLIALALGAPLGPGHSCPAGASAAACHYPPNTAAWVVEWAGGGLASGLVLGAVAAVAFGEDRPYAKRQRHLLRQGPSAEV